ncbi:MAG: hypothetical protein WC629_01615 [Candidatus Paceibacterota bacterium]|jgi:hypothetical protein
MSNSKKNWNASKANKRSADANKKTLKINASEIRQAEKRVLKVRKIGK